MNKNNYKMENETVEKNKVKSEVINEIKEDKIILQNENKNIDNSKEINQNDENNIIEEQNKNISNLNKSQILQDKLKKLFFEREANKYKYNIVKIPDNLKYTSDNSNSSSPKTSEKKSKLNKDTDVNKEKLLIEDKNIIKDNERINMEKDISVKNDLEINNNDKKETKNFEEEKKTENLDNKSNLNNNSINKSDNIQNNSINNSDIKFNINFNNNFINSDKNSNDKNLIENNQTNKNYVIKRFPERKKNRNINKNNEEDIRNRTFSMGFIKNRKKNIKNNNINEQNYSINKNEKEENESKEISNNPKEENEEEKNKRLYRLLMTKKLGSSQNIIRNNINQIIESDKKEKEKNLEICENNNNTQTLKTHRKQRSELIDETKEIIKKDENKDDNNLLLEEKNIKDRSKSIKPSKTKEIKAKEGALKILELIKAKKNEKNFIDQTKEIIKKAKSQTVEITGPIPPLVAKGEENLENKTLNESNENKTIQTKEKQNNENEKNIEINEDKIEKNEEKIEKKEGKSDKITEKIDKKEEKLEKKKISIKDVSKKIYTRFKGKPTLIGNNKLNQKNEFDNNTNVSLNNIQNNNYNINQQKNNEFNKNGINIEKNDNIGNKQKEKINTFDNNGYKTEIEDNTKNNTNINTFGNKPKNKDNNLILSSEEKLRRQKLEKDLAAEINKDELTGRENKEIKENKSKIITKNKFIGMNKHNTTINITNKQSFVQSNKKPKIFINQPNNENIILKSNITQTQTKIKKTNNLEIFSSQKDISNYSNTIVNNKNQNFNFYANTKNKNYEQIKTYQNDKKSVDKINKNININIKSQNKSNHIYAPKKCHKILSRGKTKINDISLSPFSPDLNYSKNISNKKNKSPQAFNLYNDKITYIRKNLSNASAKKIDYNNRLNNSLENIPTSLNTNFDINKIIKNKMSTEIDSLEVKPNLNSSFQIRMNLEKNKYNTGNIFNQDDDNIIDNINPNLNAYSNNKVFKENLSKSYKVNNINNAYNTFYLNNNKKFGDNYINKINYKQNNNNFNINNIYNYKNENQISYINKYENNNYNSINIYNNINNNNYQINLYDSLKYEDLLILEDKLMNIMISLDNEKLISNECFDYWNYFFNCSLYDNINKIFSSFDQDNKSLIKGSINYNLMSIILSYDVSYEPEKLDKIRPLLLEMLELCHKLLINTYEYILNVTKNNNNIWIKKLYHLINSSRLSDGSESLFIESSKMSDKEKMKYNINFLMQKIYYILYNYPSKFSQSYLMSLFKKINNKSYDDINDFFLEYILREKDTKYSILASSFLKSGELITPKPYPYLTYTSPKNYTLILDVDETLFHFKINEDDDEQGILKIRPGVFQFIDEIKEYYEIILFSEAEKNYIDLITEAVGENKYLSDYILCRDYVTIVGQNFVKELSKIGRPLDRIIIIDNMPQNFSFNKENGIYIKPFWGEENDDKALIDLIPILINIARSGKDVRKELPKYKEKIVTKISSNIYKHSSM